MSRRELLLGLTALALTMTLIAWRAYELGVADTTRLEALICAPMQDTVFVHVPSRP